MENMNFAAQVIPIIQSLAGFPDKSELPAARPYRLPELQVDNDCGWPVVVGEAGHKCWSEDA